MSSAAGMTLPAWMTKGLAGAWSRSCEVVRRSAGPPRKESRRSVASGPIGIAPGSAAAVRPAHWPAARRVLRPARRAGWCARPRSPAAAAARQDRRSWASPAARPAGRAPVHARSAGQDRLAAAAELRDAGIVTRQVGEAIGLRVPVGAVELARPLAAAAALEGHDQRRPMPSPAATPSPISTRRESRTTRGGSGRRRSAAAMSRSLPPRSGAAPLIARAIGAHDAHALLPVAEAQLGGGEEPVDDHEVLPDAVVDELPLALRPDDEERRHLALADAARELDEDLPPVVEGAQRSPGRAVALDLVAEAQPREIEPLLDGCCGVLPAQRDQRVLRILPGDRGHVGALGRAQLQQVGAAVGVDDEVGGEVGPRRLDDDVHAAWGRCRSRCRR